MTSNSTMSYPAVCHDEAMLKKILDVLLLWVLFQKIIPTEAIEALMGDTLGKDLSDIRF